MTFRVRRFVKRFPQAVRIFWRFLFADWVSWGSRHGNPMYYPRYVKEDGRVWRWADTGKDEPAARSCPACEAPCEIGKPDPCFGGMLPGVVAACCGHRNTGWGGSDTEGRGFLRFPGVVLRPRDGYFEVETMEVRDWEIEGAKKSFKVFLDTLGKR